MYTKRMANRPSGKLPNTMRVAIQFIASQLCCGYAMSEAALDSRGRTRLWNQAGFHGSDISTARFSRLDQKTTGDSAEVTRFGCSGQKIVCFKNAKPPLKNPGLYATGRVFFGANAKATCLCAGTHASYVIL